jgi:hypothetical protein
MPLKCATKQPAGLSSCAQTDAQAKAKTTMGVFKCFINRLSVWGQGLVVNQVCAKRGFSHLDRQRGRKLEIPTQLSTSHHVTSIHTLTVALLSDRLTLAQRRAARAAANAFACAIPSNLNQTRPFMAET